MNLIGASGRELKDIRQRNALVGGIFETTRPRDGAVDILFSLFTRDG